MPNPMAHTSLLVCGLNIMKTNHGYTKKCKRIIAPNCHHAATFTCYKSQHLFDDDRTCRQMVSAISLAKTKHEFKLLAWVIMPWHVHILLLPSHKTPTISQVLKTMKQSQSRKYIHSNRDKPNRLLRLRTGLKSPKHRFWQAGGGHDRIINSELELRNWFDYIHYNPVKAGLVESPEDWKYSSARAWADQEEPLLEIDKEWL